MANIAKLLRNAVRHETGCWLTSARKITIDGDVDTVQRQVYKHYRGKIKQGLVMRASCGHVGCINIDHLSTSTRAQWLSETRTGLSCEHKTPLGKQPTLDMVWDRLISLKKIHSQRMRLRNELDYSLPKPILVNIIKQLHELDQEISTLLKLKGGPNGNQ